MAENEEENFYDEAWEPVSTDIPKLFYSDASGEQFCNCTMCGIDLMRSNVPYIIEKAFKVHKDFNFTDTVFEYAICMSCHTKMQQHISDLSKRRMAEYFRNSVNMIERMQNFYKAKSFEADDWVDKCIIKDLDRKGLSEYQVSAQFVGDKMVFTELPMMLSGAAIEEIVALLSPETLGEIDDFTDRFLGLPPEFKKALKNRDVLLV